MPQIKNDPGTAGGQPPKRWPQVHRGGRPRRTHGAYSLMTTAQLPPNRKYLAPYLTGVREGIARDLGGEGAMSTTQIVVADRLVNALAIVRLIEEFIKEQGLFAGPGILQPALSENYLRYSRLVQSAALALGIRPPTQAPLMTPLALAEIIDAKAAKRRARDIPAEEDAGRQEALEAQRARAAHAREAHMKRLAEAKAQAAAHAAGTADPAGCQGKPDVQAGDIRAEDDALVAELEKDKEGSHGA